MAMIPIIRDRQWGAILETGQECFFRGKHLPGNIVPGKTEHPFAIDLQNHKVVSVVMDGHTRDVGWENLPYCCKSFFEDVGHY